MRKIEDISWEIRQQAIGVRDSALFIEVYKDKDIDIKTIEISEKALVESYDRLMKAMKELKKSEIYCKAFEKFGKKKKVSIEEESDKFRAGMWWTVELSNNEKRKYLKEGLEVMDDVCLIEAWKKAKGIKK